MSGSMMVDFLEVNNTKFEDSFRYNNKPHSYYSIAGCWGAWDLDRWSWSDSQRGREWGKHFLFWRGSEHCPQDQGPGDGLQDVFADEWSNWETTKAPLGVCMPHPGKNHSVNYGFNKMIMIFAFRVWQLGVVQSWPLPLTGGWSHPRPGWPGSRWRMRS